MIDKLNRKDSLILAIGLCIFLIFIFLPNTNKQKEVDCATSENDVFSCTLSQNIQSNIAIIQGASQTLKGNGSPSDLAQDIVGYRALVEKGNAYPVLGTEYLKMGLNWNLNHESTHIPITFLLVSPIGFLPWHLASSIWAWFMLILIALTYHYLGASWKVSIGLTPITILWPPVATSLGQLTIIWLFAATTSYRLERKHQLWSGILIGIAATTKIFPTLLMLRYLAKKQWKTILAFLITIFVFVFTVLLIHPHSFSQYLSVNETNSIRMILRPDNAALLMNASRWGGAAGSIAIILFFALIIWKNRQSFSEPYLSSTRSWLLLNYLSVAFLPVLWTFSLAPLLLNIIELLSMRKTLAQVTAIIIIAVPFILPAYGTPHAAAIVTFLTGTGLLLDAKTNPKP